MQRRALYVHIEDADLALVSHPLDRLLRGTIEISMHQSMLQEAPGNFQLLANKAIYVVTL